MTFHRTWHKLSGSSIDRVEVRRKDAQIKTFAIDLGTPGPERDAAFKKLDDVLSELSVSVLGEFTANQAGDFAIPDRNSTRTRVQSTTLEFHMISRCHSPSLPWMRSIRSYRL